MFKRHQSEPDAAPPEPTPPPDPSARIPAWTACPKCASAEIVTAEHGVGFDMGLGYRTSYGFASGSDKTYWTWLCLDCGYFENYLTDRARLEAIRADPAHDGWKRPGEAPA